MRIVLALLLILALPVQASAPLQVAVAANFRPTLEKLNALYQLESGQKIRLSSASSGVLANQILHGAPFDMYFAADAETVARVEQAGKGHSPFCYARGQLVLVGGKLRDLQRPELSLAIANPETAPYGKAAIQLLQRDDLSAAAQRKLVRGNSVLQAYQFWRVGAVDLALVARSLSAEDGVSIPRDWYPPLPQHALALSDHPALDAYLQWLRSDTVRALILEAGYLPCP